MKDRKHEERVEFDRKKFRELVLYVCMKSESDPHFGATKLNKLLFFSDFLFFKSHRKAITGAHYHKRAFGPAPRELLPVKQALESKGHAKERSQHIFPGLTQRRLMALREPDLSVFSAFEISVVDQVIELLREDTARDVSDLSHEFPGWKLAEMDEHIPYFTVWIRPSQRPLSMKELAHGEALVRRIEKEAA